MLLIYMVQLTVMLSAGENMDFSNRKYRIMRVVIYWNAIVEMPA